MATVASALAVACYEAGDVHFPVGQSAGNAATTVAAIRRSTEARCLRAPLRAASAACDRNGLAWASTRRDRQSAPPPRPSP